MPTLPIHELEPPRRSERGTLARCERDSQSGLRGVFAEHGDRLTDAPRRTETRKRYPARSKGKRAEIRINLQKTGDSLLSVSTAEQQSRHKARCPQCPHKGKQPGEHALGPSTFGQSPLGGPQNRHGSCPIHPSLLRERQ